MIGDAAQIYNALATLNDVFLAAGVSEQVDVHLSAADGRKLEQLLTRSSGGAQYRGEILEPVHAAPDLCALEVGGTRLLWPASET